MLNINLLF